MNDETVGYVTGYECPDCGAESIGIEIRNPHDDRVEGWAIQLRLADVSGAGIRCFNCGHNVPRECWYTQDRV